MTEHSDDVWGKVKWFSNKSIIWRNSKKGNLSFVCIYYSWVGERKCARFTSRGQMNINITIPPSPLTAASEGILSLDQSQTCINILTGIMHWTPAGLLFLPSISRQHVEDWSHPLSHSRETALALRCFNLWALKTSSNETMQLMRICKKIK